MLNTSADGRYLFSGRAVDQAPVETADHILNGDGLKAGLKQIIDERKQADLGASGLGRLVGRRAGRDLGVDSPRMRRRRSASSSSARPRRSPARR